jgi:hypothetical protein
MSRKLRARIVLRQAGSLTSRANIVAYGANWRYSQVANGAEPGFEDPSYDDSAFVSGTAAFGTVLDGDQTGGPNLPPCVMNRTLVQTAWDIGTDMLLRKTLFIPAGTEQLYFEYGADNEAYIYLDGVLVGEVHNTGNSCQTRGSTSFTYDNPPTGPVILAVRAIDTDVPDTLQESFFDMKVDAIGDITGSAGDTADWLAPAVDDWSNIVGNTSTNWFDGNNGTYASVLQGGVANYWATPNYQHVNQIRVKWGHTAQSHEFYIEYSDDVDAAYLPAALGGSEGSTINPGGTWHTAIHGYNGAGGAPATPAYVDAEGTVHVANWSAGYPTADYTFDLGTLGVVARLWRFRVPASAGNSDISTVEAIGDPISIVTEHVGREPGSVTAIISDAKKIGVSEAYNSPGDFFFTLPTFHPQISACKPLETHWALEMYRSEGWKEVQQGWLVDQDPTPEETVFYGSDYLGMLARLHDERFNPDQAPDAEASIYPDDASGTGGSYYVDRRIDAIVGDQIDRAIHTTNSNVGFFQRGAIASMPEQVTIYCTMEERLSFMAGLIDSHRAGTGQRTRLRHVHLSDGTYRFDVLDNPGMDRDDLTLRYGELVQGYRVIDFGDYANRLMAIGKTQIDLRLEYNIASTAAPAGEDSDYWERQFGRMTKVNFWDNLQDVNDLTRRSRQFVAESGARGKRVGLGLRVNTLGIKDGWDIGDSVPVVIQRGSLDTTALGYNGYWTIWGWQATIDDDELDLTLTLLPKIPETDADATVSGSSTTPRPDNVGVHDTDPPAGTSPGGAGVWINATTGHIWIVDPVTGLWVDATAAGTMTSLYSGFTVKDEGVALTTKASLLDFVGAGVVASGTTGDKTITIDGVPRGAAGGDLAGTYPNPTIAAGVIEGAGRWEVLMAPSVTSPPDPIFTPDGDDWLYGWVE